MSDHDDQSTSTASLALEHSSLASNVSSRGILKKRTVEESLSADFSWLSSRSFGSATGTTVTFDSVEINEHPITLGVNPSVADGGPPIEIEWQAQSYEVTTVDDFEHSRAAAQRSVRKLGREERIDLLVKSGFTQSELDRASDEMSAIRLMREMAKRDKGDSNHSSRSPPPIPKRELSSSATRRDKTVDYGKLIKKFRLRSSSIVRKTDGSAMVA
jgi:hypothetical protein